METRMSKNAVHIEKEVPKNKVFSARNNMKRASYLPTIEQDSFFILLKKLWLGLKKIGIALQFHLHRISGGRLGNVQLPWFKLSVLALAAFVLFKKDLQFQFNMNAPIVEAADDSSDARAATSRHSMAQTVSLSQANKASSGLYALGMTENQAKTYIRRFSKVAVTEMQKFAIPASVKMAQGLLESKAGQSDYAQNCNNHFSMQCFSDNCDGGKCNFKSAGDGAHYRKYDSAWQSWRSHSKMITNNNRFNHLLELGKDYQAWARGLEKAGYSDDQHYAEKLAHLIQTFKLNKLDEL